MRTNATDASQRPRALAELPPPPESRDGIEPRGAAAATPDTALLRPATLHEAAALLARDGARAVAGGTDLLPNWRRGLVDARWLVDLSALPDFATIEHDAAGWHIGAGTRLAALVRHAALGAALPALAQAASQVAGPAHRSAATLGGNLCQDTRCVFYNQSAWWRAANGYCLKHAPGAPDRRARGSAICHVAPQGDRCHAAYAGDLAPALLALGAEVDLLGPAGTRRIALDELYRDDGAAHLTLSRHELLSVVHVADPPPGTVSAYRKVRQRAALDFALAGVAVALRLDGGGALAALAVALSGTNSRPLRLDGTADLLGRQVDDALLLALGKLVGRQASPMRSTLTAAHHRRLVAVAAAQRLVLELAAGAAA